MDATNLTTHLMAVAAWLAPALVAGATPAAQPGPIELLNDRSPWRFHVSWRKPDTVKDGKVELGGGYAIPNPGTRWILNSFTEPTAPPPGDWMAADFDDRSWSRHVGPPLSAKGQQFASEVYLLCGRLRFGVTDGARAGPLTLRLSYAGGVMVYVNGAEAARGNMPPGKVEPLTLAAAADKDAAGAGKLIVNLPANLLRKGTNVLAVEIHRAAPAASGGAAACGVAGLTLTAPAGAGVTANVGAVPPVLIWNCDGLTRPGADVKCGDALEPLRPVRLAAPRNGISSEQVVVSLATDIKGVSAAMGDLKADSGPALPAGCIQVRYATIDDRVPRLLDKPPASAQTVPIWLTARVPKDAAPGVYRGTLTISGLDRPAAVPVELTVFACTLPDLRDYATSVTLLHCPESVAKHYKVALWSDEHFRLLGRSMALMSYAGNGLLSVAAIGEDWFGDQPVIVFRKEGGKLVPDFRFLRRYLELYNRQAGPPRMLSVQVWNYSVSRRGFGRDGGTSKWQCKTIKVRQLDGDKLLPIEIPVYTEPGTEETWSAVAAGVKQAVKDLGWTKTRLLWGTGGDNLPNEEIVTFFKKIAPDMYWRVVTHGGSVAKWGSTPEARTQGGGGLILGYANLVRRNVTRRPLFDDCPFDVLKRDGVSSAPMDYLSMPPLGRIAAGFSGCGFLAFDSWAFPGDGDKQRGPLGAYVPFGNIHPSGGPFVAPGPDGADPSPQLEALRQGLQITEAVLQLRAALADPQRSAGIKPDAAAQAKAAIQSLVDIMESNRRVYPAGAADVWPTVRRIYQLLAEIPLAKGA